MGVKRDDLVFFDVDTQIDFMYPTGRLYVPGAEEIVPNLRRLMSWARENEVPVVSTADAHSPDDPEFKLWPPHCVIGTAGQRLIPATLFPDPVIISYQPGSFMPPESWVGQLILEKSTYSPEDNPNFRALLNALGSRRAVVFGVVTEFCVRATVLALCRTGFTVDLVIDAIRSISEEGGRKALEEMAAAGVRTVTTEQVCMPVELPVPKSE